MPVNSSLFSSPFACEPTLPFLSCLTSTSTKIRAEQSRRAAECAFLRHLDIDCLLLPDLLTPELTRALRAPIGCPSEAESEIPLATRLDAFTPPLLVVSGNRLMSSLGNNLPPRDPSGRFIRRTDAPSPQSPTDRSDQPAQPSEPRTPLLAPPVTPRTPTRPLLYLLNDDQTPLPGPNFNNLDSKDSPMDSDSEPLPPVRSRTRHATRYRSTSTDSGPPPRPLLLRKPPTTTKNNALANTHVAAPVSHPAPQRSGTGPAAMPPPRSNRAPHYSGSVDDSIEDFLQEYEEFADNSGLTNNQKVEMVVRYTTPKLRDFWKSLDGFVALSWKTLKKDLRKIYADTSALRRHSEETLRSFARESARSRIRSEADVVRYYREFVRLSKPLLDSQRLTSGEQNKIFWHGFHKKDRAEMRTRLIAEHPRQPKKVSFDYLDVFEVATAILDGDDSDSRSYESSDEPRSSRSRRSERTRERRYDSEERDHRETDSAYINHSRRRSPSPIERDSHYRRFDTRHPSPTVETKVVRFTSREDDEEDPDDLLRRMRGLSVRDETYAKLYTRCAKRFPNIALLLPKPPFAQPMPEPAPTASFSVQTPTVPPSSVPQPWPAPIPSSTSNPPSFFRSRTRPEGCAFCLQSGHRVRECSIGQEYVRLGHALVLGDRLSLPNRQQIPNDGTGRGLKHGIDAWLATRTQVAPVTTQTP
jgi:hypothetical protein